MERTSGAPAVLPGYRQERDETGLTKRERQVLRLLDAGYGQSEIAETLEVSKQRVYQIVRALAGKGAVRIEGDAITVVAARH